MISDRHSISNRVAQWSLEGQRNLIAEKLWTKEEWKAYKKEHPSTTVRPKFTKERTKGKKDDSSKGKGKDDSKSKVKEDIEDKVKEKKTDDVAGDEIKKKVKEVKNKSVRQTDWDEYRKKDVKNPITFDVVNLFMGQIEENARDWGEFDHADNASKVLASIFGKESTDDLTDEEKMKILRLSGVESIEGARPIVSFYEGEDAGVNHVEISAVARKDGNVYDRGNVELDIKNGKINRLEISNFPIADNLETDQEYLDYMDSMIESAKELGLKKISYQSSISDNPKPLGDLHRKRLDDYGWKEVDAKKQGFDWEHPNLPAFEFDISDNSKSVKSLNEKKDFRKKRDDDPFFDAYHKAIESGDTGRSFSDAGFRSFDELLKKFDDILSESRSDVLKNSLVNREFSGNVESMSRYLSPDSKEREELKQKAKEVEGRFYRAQHDLPDGDLPDFDEYKDKIPKREKGIIPLKDEKWGSPIDRVEKNKAKIEFKYFNDDEKDMVRAKFNEFFGGDAKYEESGGWENALAELSGLRGFGAEEGANFKIDISAKGVHRGRAEGIELSVSGPNISTMKREITSDNGVLSIYNDILVIDNDAPKGTGTRVLASQIASAREMGVESVSCNAAHGNRFVGYYTWARLGYDANVEGSSSGEMNERKEIDLGVSSGDLPGHFGDLMKEGELRMSHFMENEKSRKWWKENGWSWDAEFDTHPESSSSMALDGYIGERQRASGKTKQEKALVKLKDIEEPTWKQMVYLKDYLGDKASDMDQNELLLLFKLLAKQGYF